MKSHKYKAIAAKCAACGASHPSKKEARRCGELHLMQRGGAISDLKLQPRFPLFVNGALICTYVADFQFIENDKVIVSDVKGMKTPVYIIKRKLVKALYGFDIREE